MRKRYNPPARRRFPAKSKQQLSNREAQRSGANAEYLVEQIGLDYEAEQVARIRKRHEPYKRVGGVKNGMFKAVNTGASGPDFEIWLSDGRAGLMEVKSRKGKRIPLSAIGGAQAHDLNQMLEWGHLALVLVRLEGEWYLISFRAWTHETKRSLNASDLIAQGVHLRVDERGAPCFCDAIDTAIERADFYIETLGEHNGPTTRGPSTF